MKLLPPIIAPTGVRLPRAQVPAAESPSISQLLAVVVAVVIVAGLYLGRMVLIPITLSVLLSFVLLPLVDGLRWLRLPRLLSVLLAVLLALGVILAAGGIIGSQLASLAENLPADQYIIQQKRDTLERLTTSRITRLMARLQPARVPAPPPPPVRGRAAAAPAPSVEHPMPVEVVPPAASPFSLARQILLPVIDPLATLGIIIVVAIFVLLQREDLRNRLIRLFGSDDLHRTTLAMDEAARRLSRYFLLQLAINMCFGLAIFAGLLAIGVPNAALWGILAALLRFVPYIGSFAAALLPMALGAAVDPGWGMLVWTGALFLVLETIMGQMIEPMVYGLGTGLSPVAVVIAAIFWTWLWGPIGLILSTPLTVCLVVLGRHVEQLEFFDVLLGDSPALTPVESFYQRMLADDPDEVLEYADLLLKDCALSAYYDEVALPALRLAAADVARGVLVPAQAERICRAVTELVADLAEHDDVDPNLPADAPDDALATARPPPPLRLSLVGAPPVASALPGPVLCVAGRGKLDEAVCVMLAQLLEKHGLQARVVPHAEVSRANIGALDVAGSGMACVSYLESSQNPPQLRYLLRRLRQKLPQAVLLAGLWNSPDNMLHDAATRRSLGVDAAIMTLREALRACQNGVPSGQN